MKIKMLLILLATTLAIVAFGEATPGVEASEVIKLNYASFLPEFLHGCPQLFGCRNIHCLGNDIINCIGIYHYH